MYTIKSVIFNLDHEMDYLHFISNGEDPIPRRHYLTLCLNFEGLRIG
jgi:hypothetical protein